MNINEELMCKCCNGIYNHPIMLICCGESICKHHIEELMSKNSSNIFLCPLCDEQNTNQNFKINKIIEKLIERGLHQFKINPKYEQTLNNFKKEIGNLETILKDPEHFIFEEINELKRQVDLDRERLKIEIDKLTADLIHKLETYGKKFKTDYRSNVDLDVYNNLVKSSKKQLAEYEKSLSLFSVVNEEREAECQKNEQLIEALKLKIKKLKEKLFSNVSLEYKQAKMEINDFIGKLIIKVSYIKYF